MPAWTGNLDDGVVQGLAIYIADVRAGRAEYFDFQVVDEELVVPEGTIKSEVLDFRLEVVSNEIHKHPFSIAPMRDGSILVTEKTRGLRIVRPDGSISEIVEGTVPKLSALWETLNDWGDEDQPYIMTEGSLMDVALHPNYDQNGWVYLHYSDNCESCALGGESGIMNKLVRGRISHEKWVDEEVIWQAAPEDYYTDATADQGAGGRIAFDRDLHISVSELDTTLNEFKIYPFRKEKFTVSTMMEEFLATIPLLMLKVLKKQFGHTDIAVHRAVEVIKKRASSGGLRWARAVVMN